ncbi:MAG TPA: methylamine utilization protein, partial [Usitatibacter sp.]|nr:methylamine utilization protein [Usitatibacter sp.]
NIHDSMIGYVVVVDSPYFAKSDSNGVAQIGDLPPGEYQFFAWHYAQAATPAAKPLTVGGEANVALQFAIPLRRLTPRPPPT